MTGNNSMTSTILVTSGGGGIGFDEARFIIECTEDNVVVRCTHILRGIE